MELMVQIVNFGSAWWVRPGENQSDPKRYTEHAAYFNSTGIQAGSKIHTDGPVHGLIRFNRTSGLDPHRTHVNIGRTFCFSEVERYRQTNRLLALRPATKKEPATYFLLKVDSRLHGTISLGKRWRSADVQIIAISRYRGQQELLLLLTPQSVLHTSLGVWNLSRRERELPRLVLIDDKQAPGREKEKS